MDPFSSWMLLSWLLKKLSDHHDRYMSEEEYNRLLGEAEESKKILYDGSQRLLSGPKKVG